MSCELRREDPATLSTHSTFKAVGCRAAAYDDIAASEEEGVGACKRHHRLPLAQVTVYCRFVVGLPGTILESVTVPVVTAEL